MVWFAPVTFLANDVLDADDLNSMLRDNMLEMAPAKARRRGGYFVSTGANAIAERVAAQDIKNKEIEITGTNYTSLSSAGPEVTVTHGGMLLVIFSARIYKMTNISATSPGYVSVRVVGQQEASDEWAIQHPGDKDDIVRNSSYKLLTGLTPGSARVQMMYRSAGGTVNIHQRILTVYPF